MRLIPALTALVVLVVLYMVVFERSALFGLAGEAPAEETSAAEDTAENPKSPAEGGIGVVAIKSEARVIESAVVLRGQTKANRQVEVRAETSATVISDPLRKGAFVEKGQELCRLDIGTREALLAEAHARLNEAKSRIPESEARLIEAKARLAEANINDNAAAKLQKGGYASEVRVISAAAAVRSAEAQIAAAESGLESAEAGVEAAAAAIAAAEKEIERLVIKAPFSGLLESDTAELGSLMQPGSLCATVIQLNPIKLIGFVPETEVTRVTVGAMAGAKLATGREVAGRVVFLSRAADPTTRTFQVEIDVANEDLTIRDGQTAEIFIASEGASAHRLPQSSLTLNNNGQLGVRIVGTDNLVQFVPIELLRDDAKGVWVGGPPPTADVIIVGQDFVTEGVRVNATYQEIAQ